MQAFPDAAKPTIAVTYRCAEGHHDIRWWQIPIAIPCDVSCAICGAVAVIEPDERRRHKSLLTGLDKYLMGEPYRAPVRDARA